MNSRLLELNENDILDALILLGSHVIRTRMQDAHDVMRGRGDIPLDQIEQRLHGDFIAGYLLGFADLFVAGFAEDNAMQLGLCQLFLNSVAPNCAEWVLSRMRRDLKQPQPQPELIKGFKAGHHDAHDCVTTNHPILAALGQFLICEEGLAA